MTNYDELIEKSKHGNVAAMDLLLIYINMLGVNADGFEGRIRFIATINIEESNGKFLLALFCDNKSPFRLNNGEIYFGNFFIGNANDIEIDTCATSYFRNEGKVATINTNSRGSCKGCAFCGTNSLVRQDTNTLLIESESSQTFLDELFKNNKKNIANIDRVALCTGCFGTEERLANHISSIYGILRNHGFDGSFVYIGSELVSRSTIECLSKLIGKFEIYFTIETFTNRDKLLRKEKRSLTIDNAIDVMGWCKSIGVKVNIVTVLGLESADNYLKGMEIFLPFLDGFPIINIFQPYSDKIKSLRHSSAWGIDYYLEVRKRLERSLYSSGYKPQVWENYRSLWYTEYSGERIHGSTI